jgi:large exoprotein involved in heme utilization and adhesion
VIGRVTGGAASAIDGTLRSTIPAADLYLVNPAGIAFAPGAQLDVPGSLHAGAADAVDFEDGTRLDTAPTAPSVLSAAPPAAFGFLGASPAAGALAVSGSTLAVREGETLALLGRDGIALADAELLAPGGRVALEARGQLALTRSHVDVGGEAPGSVSIRSGRLVVEQGSRVLAENAGAGVGGRIEVGASEILVDHGLLSVATHSAGDAGTIALKGREMVVRGSGATALDLPGTAASIGGVSAETTGSGTAGTIEVDAESLTIADAILSAGTIGPNGVEASGDAGTVRIRAGSVRLERGVVAAASWASRGDAGTIEIDVGTLVVDGSGGPTGTPRDLFRFAGISASSFARTSAFADDPGRNPGDPGTVAIRAGSLVVTNRAVVTSQCLDCASRADRGDRLGHVSIAADELLVAAGGRPELPAYVAVSSRGDVGDAGSLEIEAGSLQLLDGGLLVANATQGAGNGGLVRLEADSALFRTSAPLLAPSGILLDTSVGDAGRAEIVAGSLVLDRGVINAQSVGTGEAGSIGIVAGSLSLDRAQITTNSVGGDAGAVTVRATDSIRLTDAGGERFSLIGFLLNTSVANGIGSANLGGGAGGAITLEAPEITIADGAIVATSTVGGGDGGDLVLRGERIRVADGAFVDSTSVRDPLVDRPGGAAGSVTLEATQSIEVVGRHPVYGDASRVASATIGSGAAGAVTLVAPHILIDGGAVATTAAALWNGAEGLAGGDVSLRADSLLVRGGGRVDASSFIAGPGGRVDVAARSSIVVTGAGSGIASRTGDRGIGGDLALRAPSIEVSGGGELSSRSAPGLAEVGEIFAALLDDGLIRVRPAEILGDAGAIGLEASRLLLAGGTISTAATASDGGNVTIEARDLVHLDAGEITAAVRDGSGGNITIDPVFVILQDGSRIVADAGTGMGGNIEITTDHFFAFPDSVLDASSDLGVDGVVAIHAPDVDLAGALVALPPSYLDAASLLRERCAARERGGRGGSFAVLGVAGIPPEPDGLLSAALPLGPPPPPARAARSGSTPGPLPEAPGPPLLGSCAWQRGQRPG